MAAPAGLVIATGGGAVVNPANREALAAGGTVICLETDLETILQRVGRGDDRPMLASPDRGRASVNCWPPARRPMPRCRITWTGPT